MPQPKDKDWLNGYKKIQKDTKRYKKIQKDTRPLYILSTRDPPQNKGHIQTESEGLEKNISCKLRPKEIRSHNTHIR